MLAVREKPIPKIKKKYNNQIRVFVSFTAKDTQVTKINQIFQEQFSCLSGQSCSDNISNHCKQIKKNETQDNQKFQVLTKGLNDNLILNKFSTVIFPISTDYAKRYK